MKPIRKLAIVGLGLMGGSLGMAVRKLGLDTHVAGWARKAQTRDAALRLGAVDSVSGDPLETVRDADVVVFCVPVLAIPDLLRQCRAGLAAGTVVTDVGSTKATVVGEASAALAGSGAFFVGSHPIAGSDQTGVDAAQADLHAGAIVVVTPPDGRHTPGMERVVELWQAVGATVRVMTPEQHDRILARTSHLPHLAACTLVRVVLGRGAEDLREFCGTGFRDTTRVAAGSEAIWHDVVKTNRPALREELAALAGELERLRGLLDREDYEGIRAFLATARTWRQTGL